MKYANRIENASEIARAAGVGRCHVRLVIHGERIAGPKLTETLRAFGYVPRVGRKGWKVAK